MEKTDTNSNDLNEELIAKWRSEQIELKKRLITHDTEPWQINRSVFSSSSLLTTEFASNQSIRYVAGLDISFVKSKDTACTGLFVFDITNNMELVYKDMSIIEMDQPYISGYLAYREAPFLLDKLEKLRQSKPHLYPQCIMIDGNGILHRNKFGMACHIGLLTDTPTIGVSKKLCQVFGLENNTEHKEKVKALLLKRGDHFELFSDEEPSPTRLGCAYRSTNESTNPVYLSAGHKISLETCLWVMELTVTKYRIPEPIRQADLVTREYLRNQEIE